MTVIHSARSLYLQPLLHLLLSCLCLYGDNFTIRQYPYVQPLPHRRFRCWSSKSKLNFYCNRLYVCMYKLTKIFGCLYVYMYKLREILVSYILYIMLLRWGGKKKISFCLDFFCLDGDQYLCKESFRPSLPGLGLTIMIREVEKFGQLSHCTAS